MHPIFSTLFVLSLVEDFVWAADSTALPRWGQASTLVENVLFVHGGRTDEFNQFAYSSAPVNNDLLYLPLTSSFALSSPPWQLLSNQGPQVSWHTLAPFDTKNLLLFGGVVGTDVEDVSTADSAALLDISNSTSPSWNIEATAWANEPVRRMYHSAVESGGKVYIVGGVKADGSANAFSEHYVFDPSGPSFTQLSTTNSPPDLYGHAAVMLSNGTMIVLGGFSQSQGYLLPFSTIWTLDTSASTPTWSTLNVATTNLPTPRRGFVAAAVDGGRVFIQGGATGDMQTVFEDGWVLDTTEDPMTWTAVDALSQVGQRRDHFAAAIGSNVLFGYGYGTSGPANTTLLLFDASQGSFATSFTPPAAITSPTTTTLSDPSVTSQTSGPGHTGSATNGHSSSPSSTNSAGDPSGTGGGGNGGSDPTSDPQKSGKTAVAVGVVLGVLGLLAGGAAAYYLSNKRRSSDRFHLLGASDDDGSPHLGHAIPVAAAVGTREKSAPTMQNVRQRLAEFVPGMSTMHRSGRRDMLADEDTRTFEQTWFDVQREGSVSSWGSANPRRQTLGSMVQDSLVSLRNVGGAVLAYAAATTKKTREASGTSSATYWDDSDPFNEKGEKGAFVALPGLTRVTSRPKGGRQGSYTSQWSQYQDPFADYDVESFKMPEEDDYDPDAVELYGAPRLNDPPPRSIMYSRVAPATTDITRFTPLSENPSFGTIADKAASDTSHTSHTTLPLYHPSSSENTRSSHETLSRSPRRPTSILDANPPITSAMRRSDSWWSRFTKTPLLDRSVARKPDFEFRDPNPPPRLVPIKESSGGSSSLSPEPVPKHSSHNRETSMYASVHHGRSATSLQSSRTADTAQIDAMGRTMDIIQGTVSSHQSEASGDSSSGSFGQLRPGERTKLALTVPTDVETTDAESIGSSLTESPTSVHFVQSPAPIAPAAQSRRPTPPRRPTGQHVAARVQAFEQKTAPSPVSSASSLPSSTSSSSPTKGHKKASNSVYGLAPRASLFIANPDRRLSSGES
ncbi:uncharacterized protein BXZ73DRAFT_96007 [Epithele typhae]|uniref:uncharacterized protein n=1 Tax=Epithele typhae TaxID=378194 RepID=UPI0020078846|nr:uncharacterized protein BXZ73DRAFT_96007 [Epithele typhae]KAH9945020.1 hypothetical protein BXZ73DRAFT_96007 [Epithele typhae]